MIPARSSASSVACMLGAALVLAGCAVGPDYQRPDVAMPAAFKEAPAAAASGAAADAGALWQPARPADAQPRGVWWQAFQDPLLSELLVQMEAGNQNLRLAEAQYRQSQALAQSARAGLFPTVGVSASATRARTAATSSRGAAIATGYAVAVPASWEIDLWGRVRRQAEAGEASAEASAADLEGVRLSQRAALAQAYISLRLADAQQALLRRLVEDDRRTLELTRKRFAAGVVSAADVAQAETQLKNTEAQAIDVGVERGQLEHALAVLLGKPPAAFALAPQAVDADRALALSLTLPELPVGVPSELLQRRPDIAAAERQVAAANAEIGVAQAAYFPSLTLSGSIGSQAAAWGDLLTAPTRVWSVGPALAMTLFDGGARAAQKAQAVAAYDAAVAAYRQTVLTGFQEVEDQLVALRVLTDEARVQAEALAAARRTLTITLEQYRAGTVSLLNVVVAQATVSNAEIARLNLLGRRLSAAVSLVQALGGGWPGLE